MPINILKTPSVLCAEGAVITMAKLRGISAKIVIKKLEKIGYRIARTKGSHIRMKHSDSENYKSITMPNHKELKIGLLSQIIKDANLDVNKFLDL